MNYSQSQMLENFGEKIKTEGKLYNKRGGVFGRAAKDGESIDTILGGVKETTNTAKEGDFVVSNQTSSEELYILTADKLKKRYEESEDVDVPDKLKQLGFKYYKAKGACMAIKYTDELGQCEEFKFMASWGEEMLCQRGDYLVCPVNDGSVENEVYRIEQNAFLETYE